jgi:hypothetical protein
MGTTMHASSKLFLVAVPLAALGTLAHASDFFCNNYVASVPPPHFQCVQTTVGPGAPSIISPDQAGSGPLYAASVSAGSGPFASTASASAEASPGLLRGFASAEMLGGSIAEAQAAARSDAWFAAGGTVVGAAGVAAGTPVTLRFIIDVAGTFVGGAAFTALSEATVDLFATRGAVLVFQSSAVINRFQPTEFVTTDVAALVGDSFEMLMKLHVSAGAVNSAQPGNTMSVADVRDTSHLYVDALSSDVEFIGSDGHRYATPMVAAPVPEPSALAFMMAGLTCIGMLMRRRRP